MMAEKWEPPDELTLPLSLPGYGIDGLDELEDLLDPDYPGWNVVSPTAGLASRSSASGQPTQPESSLATIGTAELNVHGSGQAQAAPVQAAISSEQDGQPEVMGEGEEDPFADLRKFFDELSGVESSDEQGQAPANGRPTTVNATAVKVNPAAKQQAYNVAEPKIFLGTDGYCQATDPNHQTVNVMNDGSGDNNSIRGSLAYAHSVAIFQANVNYNNNTTVAALKPMDAGPSSQPPSQSANVVQSQEVASPRPAANVIGSVQQTSSTLPVNHDPRLGDGLLPPPYPLAPTINPQTIMFAARLGVTSPQTLQIFEELRVLQAMCYHSSFSDVPEIEIMRQYYRDAYFYQLAMLQTEVLLNCMEAQEKSEAVNQARGQDGQSASSASTDYHQQLLQYQRDVAARQAAVNIQNSRAPEVNPGRNETARATFEQNVQQAGPQNHSEIQGHLAGQSAHPYRQATQFMANGGNQQPTVQQQAGTQNTTETQVHPASHSGQPYQEPIQFMANGGNQRPFPQQQAGLQNHGEVQGQLAGQSAQPYKQPNQFVANRGHQLPTAQQQAPAQGGYYRFQASTDQMSRGQDRPQTALRYEDSQRLLPVSNQETTNFQKPLGRQFSQAQQLPTQQGRALPTAPLATQEYGAAPTQPLPTQQYRAAPTQQQLPMQQGGALCQPQRGLPQRYHQSQLSKPQQSGSPIKFLQPQRMQAGTVQSGVTETRRQVQHQQPGVQLQSTYHQPQQETLQMQGSTQQQGSGQQQPKIQPHAGPWSHQPLFQAVGGEHQRSQQPHVARLQGAPQHGAQRYVATRQNFQQPSMEPHSMRQQQGLMQPEIHGQSMRRQTLQQSGSHPQSSRQQGPQQRSLQPRGYTQEGLQPFGTRPQAMGQDSLPQLVVQPFASRPQKVSQPLGVQPQAARQHDLPQLVIQPFASRQQNQDFQPCPTLGSQGFQPPDKPPQATSPRGVNQPSLRQESSSQAQDVNQSIGLQQPMNQLVALKYEGFQLQGMQTQCVQPRPSEPQQTRPQNPKQHLQLLSWKEYSAYMWCRRVLRMLGFFQTEPTPEPQAAAAPPQEPCRQRVVNFENKPRERHFVEERGAVQEAQPNQPRRTVLLTTPPPLTTEAQQPGSSRLSRKRKDEGGGGGSQDSDEPPKKRPRGPPKPPPPKQ